MSDNDMPSSKFKIWMTAVRPFAYTATVSAVVLGLAITHFDGYDVHWINFFITLMGVVLFHTAGNLLNDIVDYREGVDTMVFPVSGAVVRGWLTEKQAMKGALVFLAGGIACGLYLVYELGWMIMALGLIGVTLTIAYTRSGLCLKYIGLGDLTIFITCGMLPVFGTYWVQTQTFSLLPILWSLPIVLITVGILHANNWRDIEGDNAKKCKTVASSLGEERSAKYYKALMLAPFLLVCGYIAIGLIPDSPILVPPPMLALIVFLAFPPALKLARFKKEQDMQTFMMLDGKTAQLQTQFAILLTVGLVISSFVPGIQ
ncbi:MAG: prenyltransferase [Thermoplasmata archaeon]|nr:prenyltransferase [Thermoplasmata archaeon]